MKIFPIIIIVIILSLLVLLLLVVVLLLLSILTLSLYFSHYSLFVTTLYYISDF